MEIDIEQGSGTHGSRSHGWIWGGSKYSGVACMAMSSAAYSIMGLLVKLLTVKSFPSSQIVLVRCGVITLLSGLGLYRMQHPLLGSPAVRSLVIARAVVGFVALSTYFYRWSLSIHSYLVFECSSMAQKVYSIQALPLRDATILNFTMPVFTAILATCLLHESWGSSEAAGSLCSFLGVLLVTQPEFLFAGHKSEAKSKGVHVGILMAMVGACTGALSYIIVRLVGKHGEPPLVCVFAFAAFSTPLAAIEMLFQGFKVPGIIEIVQLMAVGLSAYAAQMFLTRALQLEKAARATSIQYVKVVCTYILGVVFLGERPSLFSSIGAVLIALSAAFLSYGTTSGLKTLPKPT